MYRLVIVDDEAAIRRGMCNYIQWQEMGFEVVADFEDGKETIEYIENHLVDVIITDIEMAEVTGLDLIGHIYKEGYNIKTVILSGYKLFEYAQEALKYKAEYYLLKPLKLEEVKKVFGKIKTDLDYEAEQARLIKIELDNYNQISNELQEQFLINSLVGGIQGEESIQKKCELLKLDPKENRPYALVELKMDEQIEDNQDLDYLAYRKNILKSMLESTEEDIRYYVVDLSTQVIKVIAVSPGIMSTDEFGNKLLKQLEDKCQETKQLFEIHVTVCIDQVFENMKALINYRYALQIQTVNQKSEISMNIKEYKKIIDKYDELVEIINDAKYDQLYDFCKRLFFELRYMPIVYVKQLIVDLFSMLSSKLLKMGSDLWIKMNDQVDYQKIFNCKDLVSMQSYCDELLNICISLFSDIRNNDSNKVINEAMSYMKANYAKDVSLELIAQRYFLNGAYFSRLFKQQTGSTFTDYLTDIRMKEARKLLATGQYKIYEDGQMVGYHSDKYFFRIFKQINGCSPAEYLRNRVLENVK